MHNSFVAFLSVNSFYKGLTRNVELIPFSFFSSLNLLPHLIHNIQYPFTLLPVKNNHTLNKFLVILQITPKKILKDYC